MSEQTYVPQAKQRYIESIRPVLLERFGYKSPMQIPRLEKIVLNIGVGEATKDSKFIKSAVQTLTLISGQKPVVVRAKKSVAAFKLREGMPIGVKVTLRKERMFDFVDRLIYVALPRVRDFRGLNTRSFDGNGNFAMGLREHIVFLEIDYDTADHIWGMDIVVCTTATTDEEAKALLAEFEFPFAD